MTDTAPEKKPTFREMKAAELSAEHAEAKSPPPELTEPAGDDDLDVVDGLDNASEMESETPADEVDLEEAATEDGADDDDTDTLEVRYARVEKERAELEKKLSSVTANRKQVEDDRAVEAEAFVAMKHDLTDTLSHARQGAEYYTNMANHQLQQLQSVNPATLQPEQQAQYYQQLNMATQNAQQQTQALENFRKYESTEMEKVKKREAEIAGARLRASIPEWSNEHYATLGRVAIASGFTAEEFNDITDARIIKLLHNEWKAGQAIEAVKQTVKQRKATPPKARSGKNSNRNAKGQFEQAKKDFEPGKRGSFAKMKAAQLKYERKSH